MPATGRNPYWDIVRGIAILLVILGHSIFAAKGLDDPIHVIIYSFHMPLFMIVSGYFFYLSLRHPAKVIIWKRFFQLVVPILLIGTLDWAIGYCDLSLSFKENFINWFARIIRTLWFLQALFICSMIVLAGERWFHNKSWLFYIALFILFLLTPDKLQQAGTKAMFPFFVTGFYLHQQKDRYAAFVRKHEKALLAGGLLVFVLLLLPFRFKMTFYASGTSLLNPDIPFLTQLYYNLYRLLIGCAGSAVILLLVHLLSRQAKSSHFLAHIGQHTLWLYIISYYIWIAILTWFSKQVPHSYWAALLIFFGILAISYPLAILCDRFWRFSENKLTGCFTL